MPRFETGILIGNRIGVVFHAGGSKRDFSTRAGGPGELVEAMDALCEDGWEPVGIHYDAAIEIAYRVLMKRVSLP